MPKVVRMALRIPLPPSTTNNLGRSTTRPRSSRFRNRLNKPVSSPSSLNDSHDMFVPVGVDPERNQQHMTT